MSSDTGCLLCLSFATVYSVDNEERVMLDMVFSVMCVFCTLISPACPFMLSILSLLTGSHHVVCVLFCMQDCLLFI